MENENIHRYNPMPQYLQQQIIKSCHNGNMYVAVSHMAATRKGIQVMLEKTVKRHWCCDVGGNCSSMKIICVQPIPCMILTPATGGSVSVGILLVLQSFWSGLATNSSLCYHDKDVNLCPQKLAKIMPIFVVFASSYRYEVEVVIAVQEVTMTLEWILWLYNHSIWPPHQPVIQMMCYSLLKQWDTIAIAKSKNWNIQIHYKVILVITWIPLKSVVVTVSLKFYHELS